MVRNLGGRWAESLSMTRMDDTIAASVAAALRRVGSYQRQAFPCTAQRSRFGRKRFLPVDHYARVAACGSSSALDMFMWTLPLALAVSDPIVGVDGLWRIHRNFHSLAHGPCGLNCWCVDVKPRCVGRGSRLIPYLLFLRKTDILCLKQVSRWQLSPWTQAFGGDNKEERLLICTFPRSSMTSLIKIQGNNQTWRAT